jgi:hypothetical protein
VFVWGNFGELSCEWGDLLPKDVRGDEVFGLRATAGRGVWEEGKRQGARGLGGGQTARGEGFGRRANGKGRSITCQDTLTT